MPAGLLFALTGGPDAALGGRARQRHGSGPAKSPTARSASPELRSVQPSRTDSRWTASCSSSRSDSSWSTHGSRTSMRRSSPHQAPGKPRPKPAGRAAVEQRARESSDAAPAPHLDCPNSPWSKPPAASFSEAARGEEEQDPTSGTGRTGLVTTVTRQARDRARDSCQLGAGLGAGLGCRPSFGREWMAFDAL